MHKFWQTIWSHVKNQAHTSNTEAGLIFWILDKKNYQTVYMEKCSKPRVIRVNIRVFQAWNWNSFMPDFLPGSRLFACLGRRYSTFCNHIWFTDFVQLELKPILIGQIWYFLNTICLITYYITKDCVWDHGVTAERTETNLGKSLLFLMRNQPLLAD